MTRKIFGWMALAVFAAVLSVPSSDAYAKHCKRHRHHHHKCCKRSRCGGCNTCCAPAPTCCPAPAPTCCAPAPTCCAPAPTCCAPAPTCCGGAGYGAPPDGGIAPAPKVPMDEKPPAPKKA